MGNCTLLKGRIKVGREFRFGEGLRLPAGDTEMFRKHLELQIKPAYGLRVYSLWVIGEVMGLVGILSEKTE